MKKFIKHIPLIFIPLLTFGCSTTSPNIQVNRPELPLEVYNEATQWWSLWHICSNKGLIDINLAAEGKNFYTQYLNAHKVHDDLFNAGVNHYNQYANTVTPELCNNIALQTKSMLIQIQQNRAEAQARAIAKQEATNNFFNAMNGIANTMQQNAAYMQQSNQNMQNFQMNMPNLNVHPTRYNTTCMDMGMGMASCTTRAK